MARPALKEITPVVYKDHAVKVLHHMKSAPQAECFPLHWHDRVELLLITQGSMEIQLGDERQVAEQGSLAIINVRQPHRGIAGDEGVEYQVLMFEPGTFQNNTPA
ncbi:MAG: AraC family ligand binding domain-containing protein, partial [Clostridia bacterium]|nr:AraC family ligand binding domain-containing protein [Clostridia bacterium]